jgi:hypothetical protein
MDVPIAPRAIEPCFINFRLEIFRIIFSLHKFSTGLMPLSAFIISYSGKAELISAYKDPG